MSEPRITFEEYGVNTRNTYRFFDDRIERDWKVIVRNGREVYPMGNIAERIAEQTTFAYGLNRTLRALAIYLISALVLHLGFDHPVLNGIGLVLYTFAGMAAILAVIKMKKDTWLYVKQVDGSSLFCVREKGLKGITREEFIREIQRYAKKG